jgi:hypothetical protein
MRIACKVDADGDAPGPSLRPEALICSEIANFLHPARVQSTIKRLIE